MPLKSQSLQVNRFIEWLLLTVLEVLNGIIREMQIETGSCGKSKVVRLQDWITPENRFMRQFPFLLRNKPPDEFFRAYAAEGKWKEYD